MSVKLYPSIKRIQKLVWKCDDMMLQDDLFELQNEMIKLGKKTKKYPELAVIDELIWRIDDMIDQDVLFETQQVICDLALKIACEEGRGEDLVKTFPWLYKLG